MSRTSLRLGPSKSRWLLAGGIVLVYLFLILPSLLVIPMSFGGGEQLAFPPTVYSLELYDRFFASPVWREALATSMFIAIVTAFVATTFGSAAAYGLARGDFPGRKTIGFVLLSPIILPTIVIGLGIYFYFSFIGLTGTLLGLILAHSVLTVPYVIVTVSSGIRQIDPNVEIAAGMMGASPFRIFTRVVLPQIRPSLISAALFAFLISFDEVVIAWFISGTKAATLPVVMYSSLKMEVSPIIAAAATMLSTVTILICIASALVQKSGETDAN